MYYELKNNNFEQYWRRWNVRQTPKIDFYSLERDGWSIYDANLHGLCTIATKGDVSIRAYYESTGGVCLLRVLKGDKVIYNQPFNFLLKPTVKVIEHVLGLAGITQWVDYYTSC